MNNDNFVLGFVAPFGEFYECLPFEHIKLANTLLEKMYKAQNANSVDRLCRLGWIVLEKDFVGFIDDDIHNICPLTNSQKQWLKENREKMPVSRRLLLDKCLEIDEMLYGDN